MELTWTVPVAAILAGTTYAIFARYFVHTERLAKARAEVLEQQPASKS
jgi:Tfp pilus assembly protein PilE